MQVLRTSSRTLRTLSGSGAARPKVNNLDMAVLGLASVQDVLGFEVAVDDGVLFKHHEGLEDLLADAVRGVRAWLVSCHVVCTRTSKHYFASARIVKDKSAPRIGDILSDAVHGKALEVGLLHVVVQRQVLQVKHNAQMLAKVEVVAHVDL